MIPAITASKIYSTLGNNNSLVPLAVKDIANSLGITAGSYITGDSAEGKDRFIDEVGTQFIWLFGIPIYKKVLDWTIFKPFNYDPKVDPRIMHDREVLKQAFRYADESVRGNIKKAAQNQKIFKGLTFGKFAASTILTIFSYGALTKFRYKYTENKIREEEKAKMQAAAQQNGTASANTAAQNHIMPPKFSQAFSAVHHEPGVKEADKKGKETSFTGKSPMQVLDHFMFSPTNNLMIVDGAITGERLVMSETKQDFFGYLIKEGSFWGFMYFAGKRIQEYLEKTAETKHKRNIGLDARVIESEELNSAMKTTKLAESLEEFSKVAGKSDAEIYKFLNTTPDNLIVKFAKKSDVIETMDKKFLWFTVEKSDRIDNRRYIDIDAVKGIYENLGKLKTQLGDYMAESTEHSVDKFLQQVKKLKRASVLKNIGSCIAALGIVAPAIMVGYRYLSNSKDFERKQRIIAELQQQQTQGQT